MAQTFIQKKFRKITRSWRRKMRKSESRAYLSVGVLVMVLVGYIGVISMNSSTDPKVYRPLLQVIAEVESNGNYNAYFGNAANQEIVFTSMSVQEVMDWQAEFISQGSPSSAVGRYQIIDSTLVSLVQELEVDTSLMFDESLQDRMAVALLERRGAEQYMQGKLSAEQFASNLSQEWAALPMTTGSSPDSSYYAGDGLNQSRISSGQLLAAIATIDK